GLFIRFVKWLIGITPFGADIQASIVQSILYGAIYGKVKFRGQYFQDLIAYLYLKEKKDGFYIDIGANDGISGSNTYALEQMGWKGVCIEPQPDIFKKLAHFRKCDCYNAALSSVSGENLEFLIAKNFDALSGFGECMTDEHAKIIYESGAFERINVTTKTFAGIMENYPGIKTIDFMSLDVEGYELPILNSINFSEYSFQFITVEENGHGNEINTLLSKNGYKYLMRAGCDMMFVPDTPDRQSP
ncbi:MAG: FkbM family methyltransferase, partial [Spirochaetaceae bacterium]|nr:FkbM family methyltransferase [Spirochaetaceae bacterium]